MPHQIIFLKNLIKYILQKILGINRYLFIFSRFKIKTLHNDRNEKDFFHFISLLKNKDGVIIDIGANIGIMSYHLAKSFPNKIIHAIEPIPCNIKVLNKIKKCYKLDKLNIHPIALGNSSADIEMILPKEGGAIQQGLSHVKHEEITEWNNGEQIKVSQKKLDDVFKGIAVCGIKIDVENYEYYTLKGGVNIIKTHNPIIYCELWDNKNRSKCFELILSLNYKIYVLIKDKLENYDPSKHDKQNFFFIPS